MTERNDIERLQLVLRANATTSGLGGIAGLVAAGFLSDWMGVDHVGLTAAVSAGLIAFAAAVLHAASTRDRAMQLAPLISAGDFAWVAATAVVVTSGTLTTGGEVLAILIGLMVLDFGCLQLWFRSRATHPQVAVGASPSVDLPAEWAEAPDTPALRSIRSSARRR